MFGETWNRLLLRPARRSSRSGCTELNAQTCTWNQYLKVNRSIAPEIFYVMTNIYCKPLPTFVSTNLLEDLIPTSYQKMLHKLLPSPPLDQLPRLAHNLLPNQPRRPAGMLSSHTVQTGDLAAKFDSGVGDMINERGKMLMTNMPLYEDFASMRCMERMEVVHSRCRIR